ncbi:hypothetical protein SMACR_08433 [Sordaria macrospora]|uniref:WGS project CABT00000000 data, contig 2.51 n=2 Tax=Sordaria macrospora TaxID=5147 RepID=F7W9D3_SORMK|nr:uncharacterized protein SMAC_08433 [Sordaria macrospora k-hell]KAA8624190.1 hypothetical protein SMACR_08433 [Sordaria macrospora]KAH7635738.1 hypothetical protein B0T09DRAFT_329560 [Sordaria sp. MPI-SDFR-AT-0083]WPJ64228.1 hypothetical protein SMAC4_08433 [Sordaria macrospora]CCC13924.1 unnamed protein product [Sordaria macrospora k-hell]
MPSSAHVKVSNAPDSNQMPQRRVLIIGAGISGLLLAQVLKLHSIPFTIFDREPSPTARDKKENLGWGLTIHWSLAALRYLLPEELVQRLPETYVDRKAIEAGRTGTFPFYDLSTGELKASVPEVGENSRVRVERRRLRELLGVGVEVKWDKSVKQVDTGEEFVTVAFDDETATSGTLLVACDGANSVIRRALFPEEQYPKYRIPVRVMGVRLECSKEDIEPVRALDPFFLQGSCPATRSYVYVSVLDAPGNSPNKGTDKYTVQVVVSWPIRSGVLGQSSPIPVPESNDERLGLLKTFAALWSEPFKSLVCNAPGDTEVKRLDLADWAPPKGLRSAGRVTFVGDALHPMAMYRGEGANHAIFDVLEFAQQVISHLEDTTAKLRDAIDRYEDSVIIRSRPAVFASRQACIDAHWWERIRGSTPLLSRRTPSMEFEEGDVCIWSD